MTIERRKSDRRIPPALAEFAVSQLAEAGELAAIDLTVQNVEILRAENERLRAELAALKEQQRGGVVPAYRVHITTPGEAVAGIALRQLGDESRWVEIRDLNAHAFSDIGPNDYYPVGTVLRMPSATPTGECVAVDELDISAERNAMQRQRDDAIKQLARECDDTDSLIRILGLDPEQLRTDGGFLNIAKASPLLAQQGKKSGDE